MSLNPEQKKHLWQRLHSCYLPCPDLQLALDFTRVRFPDNRFEQHADLIARAFAEMQDLENGAVANPDENRQVGHYWLRQPDLARTPAGEPDPATTAAIRDCLDQIHRFAGRVHAGEIRGHSGPFAHLLLIGIGGSALGPQLASHALGNPKTDRLTAHFFDNTDPDGIDRILTRLEGQLGRTLVVVVSKSGGTKETANGLAEARAAYEQAQIPFTPHAVAITQPDSHLDCTARTEGWLARFPLWEWVGGRTSQTSAVGLLPAALQGFDIDRFLEGARRCDLLTRLPDARRNPAMLLALLWHHLGNGRGSRDMVVIPYKDRLELFARYLQQLVMESLGKEQDRSNAVVHQGLAVYGNKGSTDQHAYIQQLREGLPNFFAVFIEVLKDREGPSLEVEPGITTGDYLNGFLLGTRDALFEKDRESITLTLEEVSPFTLGVLIALFERAVGLYASLININAYHQPGVEAGKKAAASILALQKRVLDFFASRPAARRDEPATPETIAAALGSPEEAEAVFKICQHLSRNPGRGIRQAGGSSPHTTTYVAG